MNLDVEGELELLPMMSALGRSTLDSEPSELQAIGIEIELRDWQDQVLVRIPAISCLGVRRIYDGPVLQDDESRPRLMDTVGRQKCR